MTGGTAKNAFYNDYQTFEVDPRIVYPCYKSFDEFVDLTQLRSLDNFVIGRIGEDLERNAASHFVNLHRLEETTPYAPGVREIWLTRTKSDYVNMVGRTDLWEPTERAAEFGPLMDFIRTLPFEATGRILVIYDNDSREVPAHRDHLDFDTCNEFLWFRTNRNKRFYMLNSETGEKKYVESYTAWFDAVNQYHGSDAAEGLTFSVRVDGVFTDEFRKRIPLPPVNRASTPAFWASLERQN